MKKEIYRLWEGVVFSLLFGLGTLGFVFQSFIKDPTVVVVSTLAAAILSMLIYTLVVFLLQKKIIDKIQNKNHVIYFIILSAVTVATSCIAYLFYSDEIVEFCVDNYGVTKTVIYILFITSLVHSFILQKRKA